MARLNIDDSIFSDDRFLYVVNKIGRHEAMGQFVYIAKLAQRYWCENKSLIPKNIFKLGEYSEHFFIAELLIEKDEGIYLCGSEDHFSWILSKRENGKKGGRSCKINNLEKATESYTKATESYTKANESYGNPLTLTPTLTPDITLNIKKNNMIKFDIEFLYTQYPRKIGKKKGIEFLKRHIKKQEDYDLFLKAINNYSKHCKMNETPQKFIKHFSTFLNSYEDWINLDLKELEKTIPKTFAQIKQDNLINMENPYAEKQRDNF